MTRQVTPEIKELLQDATDGGRSPQRRSAALVGAVVGAIAGFIFPLVVFGVFFGGDGQAGVAAVLFGLPLGAWIGAEIASGRLRKS
jgi:hypothetical protein